MIDLHSHVLPGIDDGPETIEDSVELARAAVAAGTATIVATPHVSWTYPNDAEEIAELVDRLNARLDAEEVELEVLAGAELAMTRLVDIRAEELSRLSLGSGPWLLVEPPFAAAVTGLDALVFDLQRQGHRVLIAHPERCPAFHRDPGMLREFVGEGILTSITAGSLVGRFGGEVRRFALYARARRPDPQRHLRYPRHRQSSAGCHRRAASGRPGAAGGLADRAGARGDPQRRRDPAPPRSRAPRSRTGASTVVAPAALTR